MNKENGNSKLNKAKREKNDEFYTRLEDIENELQHHQDNFKGKVVYLNCDDPRESNFFKYFTMKFKDLGLKKLICTGYKEGGFGVGYIYEGGTEGDLPILYDDGYFNLKGDGDFRSDECISLLKECDVVVTNPPFSLFREFVDILVLHEKEFLIIGTINAVSYNNVFPLIKNNKIWAGNNFNKSMYFYMPDDYTLNNNGYICDNGRKNGKVAGISWYTNMPVRKREQKIELTKKYSEELYPTYDKYDVINVDRVVDIPNDYDGAMGVPITFLGKLNPCQFEIIDANDFIINKSVRKKPHGLIKDKDDGSVEGKNKYARMVIRKV